ncbi:MAG TPA: GDSL-type esterase/lipase family protein [Thermoanaerobaculia bacterium]|nr:GDSL-type esterase/lipase family protein [Thermoanaerobaculia bacterium]
MTRAREFLLGVIAAALSLLPAAAQAQNRYIAFGDSITFGVGDASTRPLSQMGYPGRLDDLLIARGQTGATVFNAGLGNEATTEAVTRIDQVLRDHPADKLLLMEGTNDINAQVSIETITSNLQRIARKAEARGLKVIHASVIPRLPSANRDADNKVAAQLAASVRNLAWSEKRALADPFEVFFWETPNAFTTLYTGGVDKLHPNAAGYDKLAEIWADQLTLTDKVPPVVGSISPADGSRDVPADVTIRLALLDFVQGIDLASTRLVVNGVEVGALVSGDAQRAEISYRPTQPLAGVVTVAFRSRDLAMPANSVDREVSRFIIAGTRFLVGDLDEDGRVDGKDLIALALAFGSRRGEIRFLRTADLDPNDVIDGQDLAALAANFGQKSF